MSSYAAIKNKYYSTFGFAVSTLSACSVGNPNGIPLVNTCLPCLNYDSIKNALDKHKKSVDSLLFKDNKEELIFIEFKDQKYYSCFENAGSSAADSLYLHNLFLNNDSNLRYCDLHHSFVLVFSGEKDHEYDILFARMVVSGLIGVDLVANSDFPEIMKLFEDRVDREYPNCLLKRYNSFYVVLSTLFDSFISTI